MHATIIRWLAVLASCACSALAALGAGQRTAPPAAIFPGEDIQARVSSAPPGTTFLLKSGRHRMQTIVPRSGDTFIGEAGAGGGVRA